MENDERLMEHTEKIVADMLKYVLAPNGMVEESVEFVIIDEAAVAANGIEASNEQPILINAGAIKIPMPTPMENAYNEVLNEIEMLIAQGLDKIRAEYPMYPEFTNPYIFNNCWPNAMHQQNGYGMPVNMQTPMHNTWLAGNNVGNHVTFENAYQNNFQRQQRCIGELWNDEDEWPIVGNIPKRNQKDTNAPNDYDESHENTDDPSEEEVDEDGNLIAASQAQQQQKQDVKQILANNHVESLGTNPLTAASSATAAAASSQFQLSQTALHQTHSTMTTTTAFGVVHQQTSSTTTNFVSNNMANAALASAPAALYAQALLAQQYLAALQQRHININAQTIMHNHNSNINAAIYERFAYAQLLQQQILQQQQQQTAIAALLQQQKIVLQNNILAAAQAANSNFFAVSSNVIGAAGNIHVNAGLSLASNDCVRPSSTSITNMNMHMNSNSNSSSNLLKENSKPDMATYNNHNNCTKTISNLSIDTLADDDCQVACQGMTSKVLQTSYD